MPSDQVRSLVLPVAQALTCLHAHGIVHRDLKPENIMMHHGCTPMLTDFGLAVLDTDVVGRGIDVNDISHVINFDVPDDPDNYVHRIGRTGRMGKDGKAIMFVCPDQGEPLTTIELLINKPIPTLKYEGFDGYRREAKKTVFRELYSTIGSHFES